jgi:hypothetical protein
LGTKLRIDRTAMNLLVGHSVQGVNRSYIANLRLSVVRAAAQRIGDAIENPRECSSDDLALDTCLLSPTVKSMRTSASTSFQRSHWSGVAIKRSRQSLLSGLWTDCALREIDRLDPLGPRTLITL